jgi:hypothetical protein
MDLEWQPVRTMGTYTRRSGEGTLIETYHDGYEVNATGAYIWSLIGGGRSIRQIIDEVSAKYGLDPTYAGGIVEDFVAALVERGFVTVPA